MKIENEIKLLENLKFNTGAFILAPIWLYVYEKKILALVYVILVAIPKFLNLPRFIDIPLNIIPISIAFYCGIKGNKIAMESGEFASEKSMKYAQAKWLRWGIYTVVIFIMLNIVINQLTFGLSIFKIGANALTQ